MGSSQADAYNGPLGGAAAAAYPPAPPPSRPNQLNSIGINLDNMNEMLLQLHSVLDPILGGGQHTLNEGNLSTKVEPLPDGILSDLVARSQATRNLLEGVLARLDHLR